MQANLICAPADAKLRRYLLSFPRLEYVPRTSAVLKTIRDKTL